MVRLAVLALRGAMPAGGFAIVGGTNAETPLANEVN
jgi:hypothetical protein